MKLFHLSDLHIGLRLMGRELAEDQEYVFAQIISAAKEEQPDAVLVAGDVYDRAVPSAEAVEMFDRFMTGLKAAVPDAAVMVVSGNHDSGQRLDLFRQVLKSQNFYVIGTPPSQPDEFIEKVVLEDEFGEVCFYLLPFVKPSMVKNITGTEENGNNLTYDETLRRLILREEIDETKRNVLVSHQFYLPSGTDPDKIERMSSEIVTVGNIDEVRAGILEKFDYAALGHIHKPMTVGNDRFRYCGTPMAYSFDEAGQEKGILAVELGEKGKCKIRSIPLVPLHRVRVLKGTMEEMLKTPCPDYVSAILRGDDPVMEADLKDRLRAAFPNLLEIRRENIRRPVYRAEQEQAGAPPDPFSLCCSFLGDPDETEKQMIHDVINSVLGA